MKQSSLKAVPVLITGGCGFIGSHMAQELVKQGALVTILDNLSTGSLENIAPIKDAITLIEDDITNERACMYATKNQQITLHTAAITSVSQTDLELCMRTNVEGTRNLLHAAHHNKVQRFIFSSSAAVYGNNTGACSEHQPCAPTSFYGQSKYAAEQLCQEYAVKHNLITTSLRYFNVYGPRQPIGALWSTIRHCMHNNLPIPLNGHSHKTRDFVPVETVVQATLVCALQKPEKVKGEIFNIGTGTSTSLVGLINQMKQEFPSFNAGICWSPEREGDIEYSCADRSKIDQLFL